MKHAFDRLKVHGPFKDWKAQNSSSVLAHCFLMMHKDFKPVWQFGFYDEDTDRVTTFVCDEPITQNEASEAFKDPGKKILPLDLQEVMLTFDGALQAALLEKEKSLPKEVITTTIVVLQHSHDHGPIWNVTLVTAAFKTCNVKIDAKSGQIKSKTVDSLISLGTPIKGDRQKTD